MGKMSFIKSDSKKKKIRVVLIKPSKYDDEGYVIRHFRGVLPSNTLVCLYGLTQDVAKRKLLGADIELQAEIFDDSVQKIPVGRIIRSNRHPNVRTIVALVGVQSNQFPRAADLAKKFRAGGLQVLIGGFHVSGTLAMSQGVSQEIQELIELGISVVTGEVEDTWGDILKDAAEDKLQHIYNFLDKKPDLTAQPLPTIDRRYLRKFVASNCGTIDCSRGCPFNCTFCSIINVQGRKMRMRSPEVLERSIRDNYRRSKISFYFFTDDNFSRNGFWRDVFNMLIKLREKENIPVRFMIQVDAQSHKIPGFVSLAARAGCTSVFIGMESINPKNLKAAGKTQNQTSSYKDMIDAWRSVRVPIHAAYIIGFPYDTAESVQEDVRRLQNELGVDHVSFFMLTPIPGSLDHTRMAQSGEYMHPDLNAYDSFHETIRHPNFAPGEWYAAYKKAWKDFYTFDHMRKVLARAKSEDYWNILIDFVWHKNSTMIEGGHPMIHGFFRIKDRTDRRSGFQVESRFRHFRRRFRELRRLSVQSISLLLEMEELWLQTRKRSEAEIRLMTEMKKLRQQVNRNLHSAELQLAHVKTRIHFPEFRVPSRLALACRNLNFRMTKRLAYSRADLQFFWHRTCRRNTLLVRPDKVILNLLKDFQLFLLFVRDLARA
jgi:hypothetical protein